MRNRECDSLCVKPPGLQGKHNVCDSLQTYFIAFEKFLGKAHIAFVWRVQSIFIGFFFMGVPVSLNYSIPQFCCFHYLRFFPPTDRKRICISPSSQKYILKIKIRNKLLQRYLKSKISKRDFRMACFVKFYMCMKKKTLERFIHSITANGMLSKSVTTETGLTDGLTPS